MKCIIGHEIRTDRGFRVFEAGVDYPDEDVGDRAKYFEAGGNKMIECEMEGEPGPGVQIDPGDPPCEPIRTRRKRAEEIIREVNSDDATS